jgi:glycosyltransferase involved in cell wall biosynthesis
MAIALTEGLRGLSHDAIAWSPADELGPVRGAALHAARAAALDRVTQRLGPFDVIDAPAADLVDLASVPSIRVARSVQPVLEYLEIEIRAALRDRPFRRSTWRSLVDSQTARRRTLRGLRVADRVLALGSLERAMLLRRFPELAAKLSIYFAAPPDDDRDVLRGVRARRRNDKAAGPARKFLWIGRWTTHKGIGRLLDWMEGGWLETTGSVVTIAGCGEAHDRRLLELARRGVVEIVPHFGRAELPNLLARHDAGLFTSEVEGWGLGLQEMLESGLPVHAVEAGAVPDLRPWLAPLLLPFPPSDSGIDGDSVIDWDAYEARFAWTRIASEYLAAVTVQARRAE